MLERCVDYKLVGGGAEPIVIDQAVDFLQALLDLLTELHVHLEVWFFNQLIVTHAHAQWGKGIGGCNSSSAQTATLCNLGIWATHKHNEVGENWLHMLDTAQECHKLDVAVIAVSTVDHDIVLSANVHNWPSIVIGKGRVRLLVQM